MRFRVHGFVFGFGCLLVLQAARADDKPVDPSLLEFLGSVDTEDKAWHEYLAHTDIDQVARRASGVRGTPTPTPTPAAPVTAATPPKNPPPGNPAPSNSQPVSHP